MVLKSYAVIFAITTLSIHLCGAFNFYHEGDDFTLSGKKPVAASLSRNEEDVDTIESLEAEELAEANQGEIDLLFNKKLILLMNKQFV